MPKKPQKPDEPKHTLNVSHVVYVALVERKAAEARKGNLSVTMDDLLRKLLHLEAARS